jgi:hypothetical protein
MKLRITNSRFRYSPLRQRPRRCANATGTKRKQHAWLEARNRHSERGLWLWREKEASLELAIPRTSVFLAAIWPRCARRACSSKSAMASIVLPNGRRLDATLAATVQMTIGTANRSCEWRYWRGIRTRRECRFSSSSIASQSLRHAPGGSRRRAESRRVDECSPREALRLAAG